MSETRHCHTCQSTNLGPQASCLVCGTPLPAFGAAPAPAPAVPAGPTHTIPVGGLPGWQQPDATQAPVTHVPPGMPVEVIATTGAWAQVVTPEGWSAWVDGRYLIAR